MRAIRRHEPALELTTVNDEGLSGVSDLELLEYCWRHRWLLLSHDVSTMKLAAEQRVAENQGLHGLLLIPQDRPIRVVVESILMIWTASEFEEWENRILYLPL